MSRLAENLVDVYKHIYADDELWRLLYYTLDPLNPSKTEVRDLADFQEKIKSQRIIRAPKNDDLTMENICRLCVYFGNGLDTSNKAVDDQDVIIDVYSHIDDYENYDARSLMIIDKLNKLMSMNYVTGIGKMRSNRRVILSNSPSGYIGYRLFYTFGSGK